MPCVKHQSTAVPTRVSLTQKRYEVRLLYLRPASVPSLPSCSASLWSRVARAHHRPEAVAALDDIRRLREAMDQVSEMEIELGRLGNAVSGRSIELKSAVKKRLSAPTMFEVCLAAVGVRWELY